MSFVMLHPMGNHIALIYHLSCYFFAYGFLIYIISFKSGVQYLNDFIDNICLYILLIVLHLYNFMWRHCMCLHPVISVCCVGCKIRISWRVGRIICIYTGITASQLPCTWNLLISLVNKPYNRFLCSASLLFENCKLSIVKDLN